MKEDAEARLGDQARQAAADRRELEAGLSALRKRLEKHLTAVGAAPAKISEGKGAGAAVAAVSALLEAAIEDHVKSTRALADAACRSPSLGGSGDFDDGGALDAFDAAMKRAEGGLKVSPGASEGVTASVNPGADDDYEDDFD